MKPVNYIPILFVMILSSCGVYLFENPQPLNTKELKVVPAELIGMYIEKKEQDSLIITNDSYNYLSQDSEREGSLHRGNVVLKKMNDYYILSQKVAHPLENSSDSLWEVYAVKYKRNGLSVYSLTFEEDNREQFNDSVMKILPVKEQNTDGDTLYVINPTKREFKTLLESKLYRKVLEFKKIK